MEPGRRKSASGKTVARPDARLARAKIGSVAMSVSPSRSAILTARTSRWERKKPWVRTAPLGTPVPPLVNVRRAGASGATPTRSSHGGASINRFHETAPPQRDIPSPTTKRRPIWLTARTRGRNSRWARAEPTNASGGESAHARLITGRPALGSTNIATTPRRNRAARTTYNSDDIGAKTSAVIPDCTPAARSPPATRADRSASAP